MSTAIWYPAKSKAAFKAAVMCEDVARTVAFLASDAASYISGIDVAVDGAYSLNLVRHDSRDEV